MNGGDEKLRISVRLVGSFSSFRDCNVELENQF